MKISIIGAGNVGSALAERVLAGGLADVVLLDIAAGLAEAKAMDLLDAAPLMGYKRGMVGTNNYEELKNSLVVVITAGFPRQSGMSRDDLIRKNSLIINAVIKGIKEFAPASIIVMVTNPLDIMTYLAYAQGGCDRRKIIGMAGNLDTARFKALLSQRLGVAPEKIETLVLGSHGDTMVPLVSRTFIDGKPLEKVLKEVEIEKIVERAKKRGGEIVELLKSGSAYFSPSAACFEILKAIINDEGKIIPCSCVLDGEYGISNCAIGVPAKLGRAGILDIPEWELPEKELAALRESAEAVKTILKKEKTCKRQTD